MSDASINAHAMFGEGGPLRRIEARCHLTQPRSQIVTALLVAWVPIVAIGFVTELVEGYRPSVLHDAAVHVRLLVAVPGLLILDRVFPWVCSSAIDQLSKFGFIRPEDRPRFERTVRRTSRLGELWLPECLIACAAIAVGVGTLLGVAPISGVVLRGGLTPCDWWYALVSLPLFEFLLVRSLWRWVIWVRLLVGLAWLDLDLDTLHPDRRGGIAFLRIPSLAYCSALLLVASAVLSTEWSSRFEFVTATSFVPMLVALAAIATIIAFGPLMLFSFKLNRARHEGLFALSGMAALNGRWFRRQWMASAAGEAVTSQDVQSLAAIASTYRETVNALRVLPFEKRDLVLVLLSTLIPVVPSMLMRIPQDEWVLMVSILMKGGLP